MLRPLRILLCAGILSAAACGSGSPTPPATSASHSATAGPASATPSPTPAAPAQVVWSVTDTATNSLEIREVPLAGGPARSVAKLSGGFPVAADRWHVAVLAETDIKFVDLASGAVTSDPAGIAAGSGVMLGGAFSPDGTKFAVAAGNDPASGVLDIVDIASGHISALVHFPGNPWDVPARWATAGIACLIEAAFADGNSQGAALLDAHDGHSLATTNYSGGFGSEISADGTYAAVPNHDPGLGDDADMTGPGSVANTLRTYKIGGSPAIVRQKAHHSMTVLAVTSTGGVLIDDEPAAGGFAGISQSPDFGILMVASGGATTQLSKYTGQAAQAGALVADGPVVVGLEGSAGATLEAIPAAGGTPTKLDSAGGGSLAVGLVTVV